jgi:hypothetical protein
MEDLLEVVEIDLTPCQRIMLFCFAEEIKEIFTRAKYLALLPHDFIVASI